jgi:uncharacterized protein YbjT (DUF2867 family)
MALVITGANGFVGDALCRHLAAQECPVISLGRRPPTIAQHHVSWSLEDAGPIVLPTNATAAVHLAHDFNGAAGHERSVVGTVRLVRQLAQAGVTRQVVVSSYSAHAGATSHYGRAKCVLEHAVRELPHVVIARPGLILGDGGLVGRLRTVAHWPLVPIPRATGLRIPVITLEDCVQALATLATTPVSGREYNLFEAPLLSLEQLVARLNPTRRDPRFLRLPWQPAWWVLRGLEALGIPTPVRADNLSGLLANRTSPHQSSLVFGQGDDHARCPA